MALGQNPGAGEGLFQTFGCPICNARIYLIARLIINIGNYRFLMKYNCRGDISIAIFSSRETVSALTATIAAAIVASPKTATIDVVVNGNTELANEIASKYKQEGRTEGVKIRIWEIALGDKANSWNQHIHYIWNGSSLCFYIDGYVRLDLNSIKSLTKTMEMQPDALGGSGMPSVGRSAKLLRQQMRLEGGFHGNLCCIRGTVMSKFRDRGIFLPLGLYRTDSCIAAILGFGLDPTKNRWNLRKFIAVDEEATWVTDQKVWWSYSDIMSSIKRLRRQAQGALENNAIRNHFALRNQLPESLPSTVSQLIIKWVESCPDEAKIILGSDFLVRQSLKNLHVPRDWSATGVPPLLLYESQGLCTRTA